MKKYNSIALLDQLQADTRQMILRVTQLQYADPGLLLENPGPGQWSVVEILDHLNSYTRYYLGALENSLQKEIPAVEYFKPGLLGDYFTKLMQPGENGRVKNKMRSPKDHRPSNIIDTRSVIKTFLEHQQYLLNLLEKAKTRNIGKLRTSISISALIKLKTGDVFRFLIAHEQRHFVQLENAMDAVKAVRTDKYPAALPAV